MIKESLGVVEQLRQRTRQRAQIQRKLKRGRILDWFRSRHWRGGRQLGLPVLCCVSVAAVLADRGTVRKIATSGQPQVTRVGFVQLEIINTIAFGCPQPYVDGLQTNVVLAKSTRCICHWNRTEVSNTRSSQISVPTRRMAALAKLPIMAAGSQYWQKIRSEY